MLAITSSSARNISRIIDGSDQLVTWSLTAAGNEHLCWIKRGKKSSHWYIFSRAKTCPVGTFLGSLSGNAASSFVYPAGTYVPSGYTFA